MNTFDHSRETLQRTMEAAGVVFKGETCKCPFHDDHKASGGLYEKNGAWRFKCLACGEGGDAADVSKLLNNGTKPASTPKAKREELPKTAKSWLTLDGAIAAAMAGVKMKAGGAVVAGRWLYQDANGADAAAVVRFDTPTEAGAKQSKRFRPFHTVAGGWALGDPAGQWPLFRLPQFLAAVAAGTRRVWVVEGEKAADAAAAVGLVVTTSAHGSQSPNKTDWTPLSGVGEVIILPDNDDAGWGYANAVAGILSSLPNPPVVKIVRLPDLPPKGDFYDFQAECRDGQDADTIREEVDFLADVAEPVTVAAAAVQGAVSATVEQTRMPIQIIDAAQLIQDLPELRPAIIEGLLRRGEVSNLIAAPKTGKSWAVHNLILAMVQGGVWFGFRCVNGRVLLIDNELHAATLSRRLSMVASAYGVSVADLVGRVDVVCLRGDLRNLNELGDLFRTIECGKYAVVIIDSLYRAIPPDIDDNSNVDVTRLYNSLDQYAAMLDAAFMVIHHSSKGVQGGKAVTDVGAGAGAQSRAADSHVTLRPHVESGVIVLDAVVRSFPPPAPSCWAFEVPTFCPRADLDPAQLKTERMRKPKADMGAGEVKTMPEPWTSQTFAEKCLSDSPRIIEQIESDAVGFGLNRTEARRLLKSAVANGMGHKWDGKPGKPSRFCRLPEPLLERSSVTAKA